MSPEEKRAARVVNEKLKLFATNLSNGALAIAVAAGAILYTEGWRASSPVVFWFVVGLTLMIASGAALDHMKADE